MKKGEQVKFTPKQVKQWLLDNYEPYLEDDLPSHVEIDKVKSLANQFRIEYYTPLFEKQKYYKTAQDCAVNWLQSLPSTLSTPFNYHDIAQLLLNDWKVTDDEDKAYDGQFQQEQYWNRLALAVLRCMD